jgi:hypothetical protein
MVESLYLQCLSVSPVNEVLATLGPLGDIEAIFLNKSWLRNCNADVKSLKIDSELSFRLLNGSHRVPLQFAILPLSPHTGHHQCSLMRNTQRASVPCSARLWFPRLCNRSAKCL